MDSLFSRQAQDMIPTCWGCNKKGHIRKRCPHKTSGRGSGFTPKGSPRAGQQLSLDTASAHVPTASVAASASPAAAQETVQELFSTNADFDTNNLLRFNGHVRWWDGKSHNRNHQTAYTLLDNGASDLFVSRKMANSLVSEGAGEIVNTGKMVRVKVVDPCPRAALLPAPKRSR
jgi:hypothetical protein